MKLFHFTPTKYHQDILLAGLKINTGNTGFCREFDKNYRIEFSTKQHGLQPIFLTSNPSKTVETMLGNSFENFALLSITEATVIPEHYPMVFVDLKLAPWDGFSYVCKHDIDITKIKTHAFMV